MNNKDEIEKKNSQLFCITTGVLLHKWNKKLPVRWQEVVNN